MSFFFLPEEDGNTVGGWFMKHNFDMTVSELADDQISQVEARRLHAEA